MADRSTRSKFRIEDYIGTRFGKRVVVGSAPRHRGYQRWRMRCDCGNEDDVAVVGLMKGRAKSCRRCIPQYQERERNPAWKGSGSIPATSFNRFRKVAAARGLPWDITIEQLDDLFRRQNGRCAFTGEVLIMRRGNGKPCNASLDRKDSKKGYTMDNVQFTTIDVNMAKQRLTGEQFVAMCRAVALFANG